VDVDHHPGAAARFPSFLRAPTPAEERSADFQVLPFYLGLLVWSAWDDFQREFGDYSPECQQRRRDSVAALSPVLASASWWPDIWRRALAARVPPEWNALRAVPIGRVLWNPRFLLQADRRTPHALVIDQLVGATATRPMSDGYIEGPLMGWFTSLAQVSRHRGLALPEGSEDRRPYTSFWSRVHPDLWLSRSDGAVLSSWMRGVDELTRPTMVGEPAALPPVVALLEERDLLRGAIRLTSRPAGSKPVVPFGPGTAGRLDHPASASGPLLSVPRPVTSGAPAAVGSSPIDFLVADLMDRLGPRGARTLPLTSHTNLMDEWVHLSDAPALLESIRCGWTPTNPQMHTMLRGLWAASIPPLPGSSDRVLLSAMTRSWWAQRSPFTPLSVSDTDVLLSSSANANYTGPGGRRLSDRRLNNNDWAGSGDVLRWDAPDYVLLRSVRAQDAQGKISWPNAPSGVAHQPWFDVRDDRVLLERRLKLVEGLSSVPAAPPAPRRFRRF
jgi:hypothetical protein